MELWFPLKKDVPSLLWRWWNFMRRRMQYVWIEWEYPVLCLPEIRTNEHGHKWLVSDSENRDGTSATWWCGIHLLLQEPPAGKIAQMGWRWFLAVPEAIGARNLWITILWLQEQTMQNAVQDTIGHHERNLPKKHEIQKETQSIVAVGKY